MMITVLSSETSPSIKAERIVRDAEKQTLAACDRCELRNKGFCAEMRKGCHSVRNGVRIRKLHRDETIRREGHASNLQGIVRRG